MNNVKLIKASAGSGKTWKLMDLVAKQVMSCSVKPSEFLITTFTNKAASELQGRIRLKFLEKEKPEIAAQMSDSLIGTVNSVCVSFLNDYALFAGLSPSLDVIPENTQKNIFRRVAGMGEGISKDIQECAARLGFDSLSLSLENQSNFFQNNDWQESVQKIVNTALSNDIGVDGILESGRRSAAEWKKILTGRFPRVFQKIYDLLSLVNDLSEEQIKSMGSGTQGWIESVKDYCRHPSWKAAFSLSHKGPGARDKKYFPEELIQFLPAMEKEILESEDFLEDLCRMTEFQFQYAAALFQAFQDYKKGLGLTEFADQEMEVLRLLRESPDFRALTAEQVRQIMVDEFQDTNPIQLALFSELHQAVQNGESPQTTVWVGDAKQSIYGFRGADMNLAQSVGECVESDEYLDKSWRSKPDLVRFSNNVFTRVFHNLKPKDVKLDFPDERKSDLENDYGKISAWHLTGSNQAKRSAALARRIARMIGEGTPAGDIAVLCKSNEECAGIGSALSDLHVPVSVSNENWKESAECQLALAAYRYAVSDMNRLSGFLYSVLTGLVSDHIETLLKGESDGKKTFELFRESVCEELRNLKIEVDETPREFLERVITILRIDEFAAKMTQPEVRLRNLDLLRKSADEYAAGAPYCCKSVTLTGFPEWVQNNKIESKTGQGKNAVNVLTYHSAKGLEWPIVILSSLSSQPKYSLFNTSCYTDGDVDPADPLKNRLIHSWLNPFGGKKSSIPEFLNDTEIGRKFVNRAVEEEARLFYVGVTRAKDQIIFALDAKDGKVKDSWLQTISPGGVSLFNWPDQAGVIHDWTIGGSEEMFTLETEILSENDPVGQPKQIPAHYTDADYRKSAAEFYPAFVSPSQVPEETGTAVLVASDQAVPVTLGSGDRVWERYGDAVHAFLALPAAARDQKHAETILRNWGFDESLANELLDSAKWFDAQIAKLYPGASVMTEIPVSLKGEHGESYQGYIDYLIETPDGFAIVDHKTHPAEYDAEQFAATRAAQLRVYREGIEGTGRKVLGTFIHLPSLRRIYEVK